jgi:hypothetical protein
LLPKERSSNRNWALIVGWVNRKSSVARAMLPSRATIQKYIK